MDLKLYYTWMVSRKRHPYRHGGNCMPGGTEHRRKSGAAHGAWQHFPSENREENPLLTRGYTLPDRVAFSFGKQGGLK